MLRISTSSGRTPTPSEVSPTPSLDSTGNDPLKYLEEDNLEEDSTNVVVGKNTRCLICNYVFHSESDFVDHGRVHFGNAFQSDFQHHQVKAKPPPYGSHHYPSLPPPMYNWNPYTCSVCQVGFNSYDILMCHVKLYHCHPSYTDRVVPSTSEFLYYNPNFVPRQEVGKKCSCSDCVKTKTSTTTVTSTTSSDRPPKRKRVEKEDLDEATLAKMREMEWERRKGYWCTKCNVRFDSQICLVDHMSSKEHSAKK